MAAEQNCIIDKSYFRKIGKYHGIYCFRQNGPALMLYTEDGMEVLASVQLMIRNIETGRLDYVFTGSRPDGSLQAVLPLKSCELCFLITNLRNTNITFSIFDKPFADDMDINDRLNEVNVLTPLQSYLVSRNKQTSNTFMIKELTHEGERITVDSEILGLQYYFKVAPESTSNYDIYKGAYWGIDRPFCVPVKWVKNSYRVTEESVGKGRIAQSTIGSVSTSTTSTSGYDYNRAYAARAELGRYVSESSVPCSLAFDYTIVKLVSICISIDPDFKLDLTRDIKADFDRFSTVVNYLISRFAKK